MRRPVTRKREGGFALLLVFLMAAAVAIMLFRQLPRVAFESERDKEDLLITRGEQYKRAIQLYVIATKKYPNKIEDLENTNDKRYLRRRYIDPMTGKDEWRLIHVNAAGVLTDSLVEKPPTPLDGKTGALAPGTSTTTGTGTATATPAADGQTDVNAAVLARPSDRVGSAYRSVTTDPNDPSTWAPITLTPNGVNGARPGAPAGFNPGQPTFPGQPGVGVQGGIQPNGITLPGQPGFNPNQNQFKVDANGQLVPITTQPGQVVNSQTGGVQPTPNPTPVGGAPGANNPTSGSANPTPGGQSTAINMINNMLTQPRAAPGVGSTTSNIDTGGGVALAGVASTFTGPSIKVYGEHQKFQEWEFVFKNNTQNGQKPPGQNANPLGPGGQTTTPAPGTTPTTPNPTP
jgi:hypothetical protein